MTSRGWCFTSFSEDAPTPFNDGVVYAVQQKEICPETGRVHWQGYVYFKNPVRRGGILALVPGAHVEPRKGSHEQARDYCIKTETRAPNCVPMVWGVEPTKGTRTDLKSFAAAIKAGANVMQLNDQFGTMMLKYGNSARRMIQDYQNNVERTEAPTVYFLWGAPRTGKTSWVYKNFDKQSIYRPINGGQKWWWNGYIPSIHTVVLFDEVSFAHSRELMLQWLDGNPVSAETKGGDVNIAFKVAVFTTNKPPDEIPKDGLFQQAFLARCHVVHNVRRDSAPSLLPKQQNAATVIKTPSVSAVSVVGTTSETKLDHVLTDIRLTTPLKLPLSTGVSEVSNGNTAPTPVGAVSDAADAGQLSITHLEVLLAEFLGVA